MVAADVSHLMWFISQDRAGYAAVTSDSKIYWLKITKVCFPLLPHVLLGLTVALLYVSFPLGSRLTERPLSRTLLISGQMEKTRGEPWTGL